MLRVVDESPRELDELRSQLEARFHELNDDLTKVTSSYSWQLVGIKKPHIGGTQKIAVASQREFETRSAVFGEIDELKARYNKEVIPLAERIQALESEEKSDLNSVGTG
jgi:hypothetical protein